MSWDANVNVQLVADNAAVPPEDVIINLVNKILEHTDNKNKSLTVRVVEADEIQALNVQFRGKDGPTNVLSFPSAVPGEIEPDYLGDIVICASVVDQEAALQGKRIDAHWTHMLTHGVLHLLGYDHVESADAEVMEALEVQILADMGIADPYRA